MSGRKMGLPMRWMRFRTGGGGTHSASGNIVIPQDIVVSQSGTPTVLFPGLQLPFVPDYLVLWIDKADYEAGANVSVTPFIEVTRKHDTYPPFRFTNAESTVSIYENEDYFFRITNTKGTCTDPAVSGGYGISVSILVLINLTSSPGWAINSNGTLTVGTAHSGGDLTISAATWHYYALKG